MKRHTYYLKFVVVLMLGTLLTGCCARELCSNQMWMDLAKNTEGGYTVPYLIRYDQETWRVRRTPLSEKQTFTSRNGRIQATFRTFAPEPDMTTNEMAENFRLLTEYELAQAEGIEYVPQEIRELNGAEFVYQQAKLASGPQQGEVFEYLWVGEKGTVSLLCHIQGEQSSYDEEIITEFLRGFSLDGNACKGVAGLRFLKDCMETISSGENSTELYQKPGIRFHKS